MSVLAKAANEAVFKPSNSSNEEEDDGSDGEGEDEPNEVEGEDIEEVDTDGSESASVFSFIEAISSWKRAMAPQQ